MEEPTRIFFFFFSHSIGYWLCYYNCPIFLPFIPLHPTPCLSPVFPSLSSWAWLIGISSLASPFPILFITSPVYFFIVVQVKLSPFDPHHLQPLQPYPHLTLDPTLHWLYPCLLYTCYLMTIPPFAPVITSHHPSGYCQFVLYFSVSGYILLICLFHRLGIFFFLKKLCQVTSKMCDALNEMHAIRLILDCQPR